MQKLPFEKRALFPHFAYIFAKVTRHLQNNQIVRLLILIVIDDIMGLLRYRLRGGWKPLVLRQSQIMRNSRLVALHPVPFYLSIKRTVSIGYFFLLRIYFRLHSSGLSPQTSVLNFTSKGWVISIHPKLPYQ